MNRVQLAQHIVDDFPELGFSGRKVESVEILPTNQERIHFTDGTEATLHASLFHLSDAPEVDRHWP